MLAQRHALAQAHVHTCIDQAHIPTDAYTHAHGLMVYANICASAHAPFLCTWAGGCTWAQGLLVNQCMPNDSSTIFHAHHQEVAHGHKDSWYINACSPTQAPPLMHMGRRMHVGTRTHGTILPAHQLKHHLSCTWAGGCSGANSQEQGGPTWRNLGKETSVLLHTRHAECGPEKGQVPICEVHLSLSLSLSLSLCIYIQYIYIYIYLYLSLSLSLSLSFSISSCHTNSYLSAYIVPPPPHTHTKFHMHSIVCLVVDECHRAVGNAPAAEAADILRKDKAHFRMLGLSATPGKSHEAVQVRVHLVLRVHLILCAPGFAGAPVFACT